MNKIDRLRFLRHHRNLFESQAREDMYWFFREQFRFGHREILLNYLQKSWDNLIVGFLQHGSIMGGNWNWQELPQSFQENYPVFVWSKIAEDAARNQGMKHVKAIGSPWLYLLDMNGISSFESHANAISKSKKDYLIVPDHGSGHFHAKENYEILPHRFRKLIGDSSASVLLYYTEFCDSHIRKSWERYGFNLKCNGLAWGAEHRTLWTYNGGRPGFLKNALDTILGHSNVICESATTFGHYSVSLGVPTMIMEAENLPIALGIVSEGKGVERQRGFKKNADMYAYQMFGNDFYKLDCSAEKIEKSRLALGIDSKLSKIELMAMLPLKANMIPVPESEMGIKD